VVLVAELDSLVDHTRQVVHVAAADMVGHMLKMALWALATTGYDMSCRVNELELARVCEVQIRYEDLCLERAFCVQIACPCLQGVGVSVCDMAVVSALWRASWQLRRLATLLFYFLRQLLPLPST
jgi:hypothetical protein